MTNSDKKLKNRILVGCAVFLFIVVIVLSTMTFLVYRSIRDTSHALEARLEEIRAEGNPVSLEELARHYDDVTDGKFAGSEADRILHLYELPSEAEVDLVLQVGPVVEPGMEILPEHVEATERHVRDNQEFLRELKQLLDTHDNYRYPIEITDGPNMWVPHLRQNRNVVRVFAMEAYLAAERRDEEKIVQSLDYGVKLANSLRDEPLMLSQLVRSAGILIVCQAIEEIVVRYEVSENTLFRMQHVLDEVQLENAVRTALIGERCLAISTLESTMSGKDLEEVDVPKEVKLISRLPGSKWYFEYEMLIALDGFDDLFALGLEPSWDRKAATIELSKSVKTATRLGHTLMKGMLPSYVRSYDAATRPVAAIRTMKTGIAVKRFEMRNGRSPTALSELVPEFIDAVPQDPFSGEPLVMKSTNDGLLVYSLSNDREDDGGYEPERGVSVVDDGDIVFDVRRSR